MTQVAYAVVTVISTLHNIHNALVNYVINGQRRKINANISRFKGRRKLKRSSIFF